MADFPAIPIQTDVYLADTRHLTTAQHGANLLMMITAWRHEDNSLPNDDIYLARITGMGKKTWEKNKDVILQLWTLKNNNRWAQDNLDAVKNYVKIKRIQNSKAGKASALKKKEIRSTDVDFPLQRKDKIVVTENQPYNTNTNTNTTEGDNITVRETREEDPPLKNKDELIKVSPAIAVGLMKKQERKEILTPDEQKYLAAYRQQNGFEGFEKPKTEPPPDPWQTAKDLIYKRDFLKWPMQEWAIKAISEYENFLAKEQGKR